MEIISAIASINALIIALLISLRKQKSASDYILIAWVINFAFHFATPFLIERNILLHEMDWGVLMAICVAAHAPFIFVYTNSLTNPDFRLNFKNLYHFGAILLFLAAFIPYFSLTREEQTALIMNNQEISYYLLLPLLVLVLIRVYFLIRTILVVMAHQYRIRQSYSYTDIIDLAWIKRLVYGFFAIIVIGLIGIGMVSSKVVSMYWMDYITIICNMVLFFYLAFSSYRQTAVQNLLAGPAKTAKAPQKKPKVSDKPQTKTSDPADIADPVIQQLFTVMEEEKLYLEPELNIATVATKLKTHAHKLSKLLNNQLGKSFFEFVNEYRVEEFKKLVANPKNKHISILGLAMDAGFNSKASFNRIFKNQTGSTPSQFRESYKY